MIKKKKLAKYIFIFGIIITLVAAMLIWKTVAENAAIQKYTSNKQTQAPDSNPKLSLTLTELAQYNGNDPAKPIYLVFQGNIYDVTSGKEFYQPGGSYHYLAGADSTPDLELIGGNIIKVKYPIVGVLKR